MNRLKFPRKLNQKGNQLYDKVLWENLNKKEIIPNVQIKS